MRRTGVPPLIGSDWRRPSVRPSAGPSCPRPTISSGRTSGRERGARAPRRPTQPLRSRRVSPPEATAGGPRSRCGSRVCAVRLTKARRRYPPHEKVFVRRRVRRAAYSLAAGTYSARLLGRCG
jgi:hypothetical protein